MIEKFIKALKQIQNEDNYDGCVFITEDLTIGYTYDCPRCYRTIMVNTDIDIPFDNLNDEELNKIFDDLDIEYISKSDLIYDTCDSVCHCSEEEMIYNEETDEWECIENNYIEY